MLTRWRTFLCGVSCVNCSGFPAHSVSERGYFNDNVHSHGLLFDGWSPNRTDSTVIRTNGPWTKIRLDGVKLSRKRSQVSEP